MRIRWRFRPQLFVFLRAYSNRRVLAIVQVALVAFVRTTVAVVALAQYWRRYTRIFKSVDITKIRRRFRPQTSDSY
jgi:hypothetical protein